MELCVEPAQWRSCSVVRAQRRARDFGGADSPSRTGAGADADADGGCGRGGRGGGDGGGATEEVVVTLPPCDGHAGSVSAYVHVGFGRAVETWVQLSA